MNSLDEFGFMAFIRRGGIPSADEPPIPRGPPAPPGPPARSPGPWDPGWPGTPGIRGPRGCSTGSTLRRFFGSFARACYNKQPISLLSICHFFPYNSGEGGDSLKKTELSRWFGDDTEQRSLLD